MLKSKRIKETEEKGFLSVEHAEDIKREAEALLPKMKIGMAIGAAATLCSIIGLLSTEVILGIGVALALVAYIVGGGFKLALKAAKKLGFIGWLIMPFPADLITGLITIICAVFFFFCFPIYFLFKNYRSMKKTIESAEEYIHYN